MAEVGTCVCATGTPLPGRSPGRLYDSMENDVTCVAHLMSGVVFDHRGRRVMGETAQRREERAARPRAVATKREAGRGSTLVGLLTGAIRLLCRIVMAW